jgi:hypothetical protein
MRQGRTAPKAQRDNAGMVKFSFDTRGVYGLVLRPEDQQERALIVAEAERAGLQPKIVREGFFDQRVAVVIRAEGQPLERFAERLGLDLEWVLARPRCGAISNLVGAQALLGDAASGPDAAVMQVGPVGDARARAEIVAEAAERGISVEETRSGWPFSKPYLTLRGRSDQLGVLAQEMDVTISGRFQAKQAPAPPALPKLEEQREIGERRAMYEAVKLAPRIMERLHFSLDHNLAALFETQSVFGRIETSPALVAAALNQIMGPDYKVEVEASHDLYDHRTIMWKLTPGVDRGANVPTPFRGFLRASELQARISERKAEIANEKIAYTGGVLKELGKQIGANVQRGVDVTKAETSYELDGERFDLGMIDWAHVQSQLSRYGSVLVQRVIGDRTRSSYGCRVCLNAPANAPPEVTRAEGRLLFDEW